MARTPDQNAALREATRETIETAAVLVFAEHGFAASSIRLIADRAGVSTGAIYRHHPSKDALFEALLDQATSGLAAATTALSRPGDPLEMVREFTGAVLGDLDREDGPAQFTQMLLQGFRTDDPNGTRARLAAAQRPLWEAFTALVRRGQESGVFAPGNPSRLTAHYVALLSGLADLRTSFTDAPIGTDAGLALRLLTRGESI